MIAIIERAHNLGELTDRIARYGDPATLNYKQVEAALAPLCELRPDLQPPGRTVTLADVYSTVATGRTDHYDISKLVNGQEYRKTELLELIGDIPTLYGRETPADSFEAICRALAKLGVTVTPSGRKGYYCVMIRDMEKGLPLAVFVPNMTAKVRLVADYIARNKGPGRIFTFYTAAFLNDNDDLQTALKRAVQADGTMIASRFLADLARINDQHFVHSGINRLVNAGALDAPRTAKGNISYRPHLVMEMQDGTYHRNDEFAQQYTELYAADIAALNNSGFIRYHENVKKLLRKMQLRPALHELESIYIEKEVLLNPAVVWPALSEAERRDCICSVHIDTVDKLYVQERKLAQTALTQQDKWAYHNYCEMYRALIEREYLLP